MKGYDIRNFNGIFGSKTETATKDWRKKNGLTADGIVGSKAFEKVKTKDFECDEVLMWYPPHLNFGSPSRAKVKELFGEFQFERTNGSEIKALRKKLFPRKGKRSNNLSTGEIITFIIEYY